MTKTTKTTKRKTSLRKARIRPARKGAGVPGRVSVVLVVILLIVSLNFIYQIASARSDIRKAQAELAAVNEECERYKSENEQLGKDIKSGGGDDYIEQQASDKLGYVYPDERVYVDAYLDD